MRREDFIASIKILDAAAFTSYFDIPCSTFNPGRCTRARRAHISQPGASTCLAYRAAKGRSPRARRAHRSQPGAKPRVRGGRGSIALSGRQKCSPSIPGKPLVKLNAILLANDRRIFGDERPSRGNAARVLRWSGALTGLGSCRRPSPGAAPRAEICEPFGLWGFAPLAVPYAKHVRAGEGIRGGLGHQSGVSRQSLTHR